MNTHVPMAGESIDSAARDLIRHAPCQMSFNGVTLIAEPGMTADDVVRAYWAALAAEQAAYRASPKYAADRQRERDDIAAKQAQVDALTDELATLDWTDVGAVLSWCERLTDPAGRIGVTVPGGVYAMFRAHGYVEHANVGAAFNKNDRENYARYIIGQALDGILSGYGPHPMTVTFAERWRTRFGDASPSDIVAFDLDGNLDELRKWR